MQFRACTIKTTHANITRLYAFSFLQMTLFPMAIITLFWKDHIGLSLTQILLLQGILSIVMVVMEYPSGYISDRIGYRVSLTLAALLGMVGWGVYTVAVSFLDVMAAEILLGTSLAFISGSDSAMLYETLKNEGAEQHYARHQGRMSGFAQAGEALGAVFAGVLYAYAPLLPFILQIGVWFLALLVTRSMAEPPRKSVPHAGHLKEALRTAHYAFVENKPLRYNMLLNSALGIASFYPVWLIQPYMQHSGVPLTWFGPVWSGANLTVAFFSLTSHRVSSFLGDRFMVVLFLVLIAAGYAGLGLVGGTWGFLFYYLLTSMRGLRGPMMLNITQKECPSANRAGILSLQSFCFRLLFVCTGPLVGMLADKGGVRQVFLVLLYAFLITLPPLAWLFFRNLPKGNQRL
jgi:MFS family permease